MQSYIFVCRYALGGYDGAGMAPIVEVFDPCIGLWTMGKPMNVPRGYCGAIVVGKSIYVIGGMGGNSQSEILDTVSDPKVYMSFQPLVNYFF